MWKCANIVEADARRASFANAPASRWQSRQPHPGTRIVHYRCCLPALAGFANYRRGRTDGTAVNWRENLAGCTRHILCLALRAATLHESAFLPIRRTRHFYFAGSSPAFNRFRKKPMWRRERDSNPRSGITRLHTFQACSFNHSDTSPHETILTGTGQDCLLPSARHLSVRGREDTRPCLRAQGRK